MAYVLQDGLLVNDFDLYDPELADIEVQVLAWCRELLIKERDTDQGATYIGVPPT